MNATIGQIQDMATAGNQEHFKLEEVSDMKAKNQISKWINGNNAVKMIAGLALGAMFMTAIALPSNAFADTPKRPMTSEEQLIVMAEIEDGMYDTVSLTSEQQLMVRAEIEDGAYEPVSLTQEQLLVVRAEIQDGDFGTVSLNTPSHDQLVDDLGEFVRVANNSVTPSHDQLVDDLGEYVRVTNSSVIRSHDQLIDDLGEWGQ